MFLEKCFSNQNLTLCNLAALSTLTFQKKIHRFAPLKRYKKVTKAIKHNTKLCRPNKDVQRKNKENQGNYTTSGQLTLKLLK